MKLKKSVFIAVLMVSATACFATAEEEAAELAELKSAIYDPIINNFPDENPKSVKYSSYSRLLSIELINMQKSQHKPFSNVEEANKAADIIEKQHPKLNNKLVKCKLEHTADFAGETMGEQLYNTVSAAWNYQLAS